MAAASSLVSVVAEHFPLCAYTRCLPDVNGLDRLVEGKDLPGSVFADIELIEITCNVNEAISKG